MHVRKITLKTVREITFQAQICHHDILQEVHQIELYFAFRQLAQQLKHVVKVQ